MVAGDHDEQDILSIYSSAFKHLQFIYLTGYLLSGGNYT